MFDMRMGLILFQGTEITCICDSRNSQRLLHTVGHGAVLGTRDLHMYVPWFLEMVEWEAGFLETMTR